MLLIGYLPIFFKLLMWKFTAFNSSKGNSVWQKKILCTDKILTEGHMQIIALFELTEAGRICVVLHTLQCYNSVRCIQHYSHVEPIQKQKYYNVIQNCNTKYQITCLFTFSFAWGQISAERNTRSNQRNQDSIESQKNIFKGLRLDRENRHTQQRKWNYQNYVYKEIKVNEQLGLN